MAWGSGEAPPKKSLSFWRHFETPTTVMGVLIIRTGFWGPTNYNYSKEHTPPKKKKKTYMRFVKVEVSGMP